MIEARQPEALDRATPEAYNADISVMSSSKPLLPDLHADSRIAQEQSPFPSSVPGTQFRARAMLKKMSTQLVSLYLPACC